MCFGCLQIAEQLAIEAVAGATPFDFLDCPGHRFQDKLSKSKKNRLLLRRGSIKPIVGVGVGVRIGVGVGREKCSPL